MTIDEATVRCLEWCREPREPHVLVTINAATLVMMRENPELRRACLAGDVLLPDGVPVVWAARLAGNRLAGRVAGVDLFARLLEAGAEHRLKVFLLGAKDEVVRRLVDLCRDKYPRLTIAGYHDGYFCPADHARIVELIRQSGSDMLFVAMPTPFKDLWLAAHKQELAVPVMIGVGGSFDVLAGYVKRAPGWMQQIGMEWFWRLLMEPRKMWRRYLVCNSVFLGLAIASILRSRLRSRSSNAQIAIGRSWQESDLADFNRVSGAKEAIDDGVAGLSPRAARPGCPR